MKGLLRSLHRAPSRNTNDNGRQSRFSRTSRVLGINDKPAVKATQESPEMPTHSRKRDRLKIYLGRRVEVKSKKGFEPCHWPALLSAAEEENQSSNGTDDDEDGGDVYMVEHCSNSESDGYSISENDYVTPPVEIPDMYRRQDRFGGSTVAGVRVLFTYDGFKRQQMKWMKLQSILEVG